MTMENQQIHEVVEVKQIVMPPAKPSAVVCALTVLSKIINIVLILELIAIGALAGALTLPRLFGVAPYIVQTASMDPAMPAGSLAYVNTAISGDEVADGDIIAFPVGNGGKLCTHRVVAVDKAAKEVTTKGDANNAVDAAKVSFASVRGRVDVYFPEVGVYAGLCVEKAAVFAVIVIATAAMSWSTFALAKRKYSKETNRAGKTCVASGIE